MQTKHYFFIFEKAEMNEDGLLLFFNGKYYNFSDQERSNSALLLGIDYYNIFHTELSYSKLSCAIPNLLNYPPESFDSQIHQLSFNIKSLKGYTKFTYWFIVNYELYNSADSVYSGIPAYTKIIPEKMRIEDNLTIHPFDNEFNESVDEKHYHQRIEIQDLNYEHPFRDSNSNCFMEAIEQVKEILRIYG